MKKKLLLTLVMVIALCAVLAISVSAEVTTYTDAPVRTKYQCIDSEIVEFYDGFKCPVSYVFKDTSTVGSGNYNTTFESYMDFDYINSKLGKTEEAGNLYTYADIKGFDIPTGITHVAKYAGSNGTTLKWITFPDTISSLSNAIFQNATGLEECTLKFSENNTMRVFPSYMFYGCKNLKAFSMPDCFTSLYDVAHFSGCTNLGAVHLSESLETWSSGGGGSRNASFDDCVNMYFVNETFTYENVPEKPEIYYFPANLTSISNNSVCRECKNLNDVLVFGDKLTAMPNQYFFQNGPKNTIVFLGDMTTISTGYWGSTQKIIFANANDKSSSDFESYSNTRTAVFCASEADLAKHLEDPRLADLVPATCYSLEKVTTNCFCGKELSAIETPNSMLEHEFENYDCTKDNYCKNYNEAEGVQCKGFIAKVADDHNVKHIITYTEGFTSAGLHEIFCQVENCNQANEKIDLDPIFSTTGGYSIDGSGSIAGGWTVNKDNFDLYNLHNEKDITFGILMLNPTHLASNRFLKADGSVNLAEGKKGAIMIEQESVEYNNFKFSISGFTTTELTQLELVITAYAYVEGEEVQFIQDTTTSCKVSTLDYEDASLYTVSYEQAEKVLAPTTLDALVPTNDEE